MAKGFARVIKALHDKETGAARKDNLVDEFFKAVKNGIPYSKRQAVRLTEQMALALRSDDLDAAMNIFIDLYDVIAYARPRAERSFHPSTLEGDCPRMLWFDVVDETPYSDRKISTITPELQITFDLGTWFHLYVQGKLKQSGILIRPEVPVVSKKYRINGRGDGIIRFVAEDELLEIKTMNDFSYKKAAFGPFENHKKQAGLYAKILGLKRVRFLYFNKNTSECREFIYDIEEKVIRKQIDKIEAVLDAKEPPARVCADKKCERALQCPFRTHCFSLKS